ncbi:microcin-processing peptidase 1 [Salinisphaera sp. PC39]|uniref:metallopeptidase TldD-related protein n=1 Tax=Salinisphaera sp. PC39 TaxID=1304156 RepID=UPI00333FCFE7
MTQATALAEPSSLETWCAQALDAARGAGADAAEVAVSVSRGLSVRVRGGEIDTVEFQGDRGLSVTAFRGRRSASVTTTDLTATAIADAAGRAAALARHTGEDPWAGLADPGLMAAELPELDLHHPWHPEVREAEALAREMEEAAFAADPRVTQVEPASVNTGESITAYANSHGFFGYHRTSDHGLACAAVSRDADGAMQRDHHYSRACHAAGLAPAAEVGRLAGRRAAARLGATTPATARVPVLFPAELARGLLRHFVGAISGGALYRDASFLKDRVGEAVFAEAVDIVQRPHLRRALGSAAFDADGVATRERELVAGGVLQGYLLGSYAARRLGLETTGNAGGVFNLEIVPGDEDAAALRRRAGTGLLVTELMGQGVSLITGDYSRGAAGFWIEDGEIARPVQNATIAGNLADIFRDIVAIGNDLDVRGSLRAPSLLIGEMTVGGQ